MKPVVVEMLGPSGVGKSSSLSAAIARRGAEGGWRGSTELGHDKPASREMRRALDDQPELAHDCLAFIDRSRMRPSQKVAAAVMLRATFAEAATVALRQDAMPILHDELMLHRAMSILPHSREPERDAEVFFGRVPVPAAAVVFTAPAQVIVDRIVGRGREMNVYYGLDIDGVAKIVDAALAVAEQAAVVLAARDVRVVRIEAAQPVEANAERLDELMKEVARGGR